MKILLILSLSLLFSPASYSAFVDISWERGATGNTDLTYDTITNLEWLDPGITTNDFNPLLGTQMYSGFRHATQAEVAQLFTNAGLTEHDVCNSCPDTLAIENFFGHFGVTYDWTDHKGIIAYINETTMDERYIASVEVGYGADAYSFISSYSGPLPQSSYDNVGHFLVRTAPVPIPSSIWLLFSGLGIFAGITNLLRQHIKTIP